MKSSNLTVKAARMKAIKSTYQSTAHKPAKPGNARFHAAVLKSMGSPHRI